MGAGPLPVVTRDQELWAMALWIEKRHGADAGVYIAEKVGQAVLEADPVGVELWKGIASRYDQLMRSEASSRA